MRSLSRFKTPNLFLGDRREGGGRLVGKAKGGGVEHMVTEGDSTPGRTVRYMWTALLNPIPETDMILLINVTPIDLIKK